MRTIVCIKQVPESASDVTINPEDNTLNREGAEAIINPFDEYAIEEALLLKERHGGDIWVISMGPAQAEKALKQALAMGADEAVLLNDPNFAGSDTLATSYALSRAIARIGDYDLVVCGKQAIDGDTAQVGPGIATRLGLAQLTYVCKVVDLNPEGRAVTVHRMLEGCVEAIRGRLPAVLTVVKDINQPRYPSLLGIRKANKRTIDVWGAADVGADPTRIGLGGSPTWVERVFTPPMRAGGVVFEGEVDEVVEKLVRKMQADGLA
ncbi:MAG: electron transfer flavoprotein subunit beta/FixA family protein [Candidatus Coatesbacteria bacterium]|nr:electron transfer flavoprotein subunit beta/FixA family protein [Candidatus Coatesbacteria bacterium]